ncbi:MAG: hypothetical protein ACXW1S_10360 [Acidimicrobiia bacterium]
MIPAGLISRIDADERVVHLGVAKEHVKDAPDYDAARADEATYREHVGGHYDAMRGDTIGPTAGTGRGPGELTGDPIAPVAGGSSRPQPT